jgi:hypothetical protein
MVIDIALFIAGFVVFGGAHGPAGPMFVLTVVNWPVHSAALRLFPGMRLITDPWLMILVAFVIVAVNGAAYGSVVAGFVSILGKTRNR